MKEFQTKRSGKSMQYLGHNKSEFIQFLKEMNVEHYISECPECGHVFDIKIMCDPLGMHLFPSDWVVIWDDPSQKIQKYKGDVASIAQVMNEDEYQKMLEGI